VLVLALDTCFAACQTALVRDGEAIFPRSDDILRPGDRAIIFTESQRVPEVEKAL